MRYYLVGLMALLIAISWISYSQLTSSPGGPRIPADILSPRPTADSAGTPVITNDPPAQNDGFTAEDERLVRGVVRGNQLGCTVASCFLRLISTGGDVLVTYHLGENPRCLNQGAADVGLEIKEGDVVEAFGKVTGHNAISTCDSNDYYIRKL